MKLSLKRVSNPGLLMPEYSCSARPFLGGDLNKLEIPFYSFRGATGSRVGYFFRSMICPSRQRCSRLLHKRTTIRLGGVYDYHIMCYDIDSTIRKRVKFFRFFCLLTLLFFFSPYFLPFVLFLFYFLYDEKMTF